MPTLALIVIFGLAMSVIALVGSLTLVLPERVFNRVVLPLVALAAGSLLGGTFFHLLPESIDQLGDRLGVYICSPRASSPSSSWSSSCTGSTATNRAAASSRSAT